MKFAMTREALARADRVIPNIEKCTQAARRELDKAEASNAEFFMVYREGGRPPAFRHSQRESATAEARRISRESGERTYVLAVVDSIEPFATPTVEEFQRHADRHGKDGIGLWRFVSAEAGAWIPVLIAVRVTDGRPWCCVENGSPSYVVSGGRLGKWTPLDENGKDLEDIPF